MRTELIGATAPLLAITRGPMVENVVRGLAVLVDAKGKILASVGQVQTTCYMRSTAKPFQAVPFLLCGGADHYRLTEEELAVMAASHGGEPYHQRLVLSILKKGRVSPSALQCGASRPSGSKKTTRQAPKPLYNNCSGKHAGMLLAAKFQGFPLRTYRELYHPIQQKIMKTIAELSEIHEKDMAIGVDGCGVPTFGLPLSRIAYLYARLGRPDHMPYHYQKAVGRIGQAMQRYPLAVSGTGRFDTKLMTARPGLISKGGADAIYSMSLPERGWGLTVKLEGGRDHASYCRHVMIEALCQLKVLTPKQFESLKNYRPDVVRNNHQQAIGEVDTLFRWK